MQQQQSVCLTNSRSCVQVPLTTNQVPVVSVSRIIRVTQVDYLYILIDNNLHVYSLGTGQRRACHVHVL